MADEGTPHELDDRSRLLLSKALAFGLAQAPIRGSGTCNTILIFEVYRPVVRITCNPADLTFMLSIWIHTCSCPHYGALLEVVEH